MLFGLMGKKTNVGGGTSATLIEKSVTTNGEFEATDDNADGYSKFNVAVPDTKPSDTTKTLYVVYVTKQDGTKVASGVVTFTDASSNTYTATTDSNGRAQKELAVGTYSVSVGDMAGFTTPNAQSVVGEANETNYVSLNYVPSSVTYGVKIDLANSDPETSVIYTDDSVGFNKAYMDFANDTFVDSGWKSRWPFNQIKPCLFKNGAVVKYLNPDDFSKDTDGNAVDITSGSAGDVMIEIPKIFYKLSNDENYQYIQISDTEQTGFCCYAHKYKNVTKDKVYTSAYKGYYDNTSLRSLSGKTPSASATIGSFRTRAQANGEGYQQFTFGLMTLLQCLFCVMFKNLDSQTALGYGICNGSITSTGGGNTKGMYYGTSGNGVMKFCGIEDFYGNVLDWVDGIATDESRNICTIDESNSACVYNDSRTDYKTFVTGLTSSVSGYKTKIQGTNDSGFASKAAGGSATTYYCDYGGVYASRVCCFGGYCSYTTHAGAFYVCLYYAASYTSGYFGGRLSFL